MYCEWPALQRCCFCLPLRRGVLVFAYLNVIFSLFMVGVYGYAVTESFGSELVYHGTSVTLPAEVCLLIYFFEIVFNVLLLYGAHKKEKLYVKIYYYFTIATTLSSVLIGIIEIATMRYWFLLAELIFLGFTGLLLQLYLLIMVWSLLKKLETDGSHMYENQLHQFINGEMKIESNGIYNASTIPNDAAVV